MKKILLLLTLTVITSAAFSQNTRACGQTLLDEAIKKDPSILENIKKNREQNQKWIELNKFNNKESHDNYNNPKCSSKLCNGIGSRNISHLINLNEIGVGNYSNFSGSRT